MPKDKKRREGSLTILVHAHNTQTLYIPVLQINVDTSEEMVADPRTGYFHKLKRSLQLVYGCRVWGCGRGGFPIFIRQQLDFKLWNKQQLK